MAAADLKGVGGIVEAARERYIARNPRSAARLADACRLLPGGNTRSVLFYEPFPLYMDGGEGCRLWDVDQHQYVDLLGEYTAGIYGHSHPVIRKAIVGALERGISLSSHTTGEIRLAQLICQRFKSIELIRFTNSGTEANLMAITTAIAFTQRPRIMVFAGAYHGSLLTFGAGDVPTNSPYEFVLGKYNDIDSVRALIRQSAATLAAILVEPMLGAGGCIPGDPEFLRMLADEAHACGALLIFDEIQTSRLSVSGRQGLLGIKPDLTTLGKYFGGGVSFGAFGGRADLMAQFDPRVTAPLSHAGTFNNNALSMAAGAAGLAEVLTPEVLDGLNRRGDELRISLNALFVKARARLYATGLGSIMNLHVGAEDAATRRDIQELLFLELLERGFYIAPRGLIALSLQVTERETAQFLEAVRDILAIHPEELTG